MNTKKMVSLLCTTVLACSAMFSVSAQEAASTGNLTNAATPTASSAIEQKWANKYVSNSIYGEMNSCGTPITVGEYVYVTDSNAGKLLKLDAKTGATVKSAVCANIPAYYSHIAYGDNMIYVAQQLAKTVKISAFNADTLDLVWQSSEMAAQDSSNVLEMSAPILYANNKIFFGTTSQNPVTKAYSGNFYCVNTANGQEVWKYQNTLGGYYSAGGTITGNAILVGDSIGNFVSLSLDNGVVIDTVPLGAAINSTPCVDSGKAYISVHDGNIVSIPVNANGTFDKAAKKSVKIGNNVTSSPVVYNGRLYVAGGGFGSTTPFSVIDANTMSIIYQINGILSQSTPLISTAYATKENNYQVYIYVTNYFSGTSDPVTYETTYNPDSSCIYLIKDSAGQNSPSFMQLVVPSVLQYCSQSVTASGAGWLYYYNDSGNLFAFGTKTVPADESKAPVSSTVVSEGNNDNSSSENSSDAATNSTTETESNLSSPATGDNGIHIFIYAVVILSGVILVLVYKTKKRMQ